MTGRLESFDVMNFADGLHVYISEGCGPVTVTGGSDRLRVALLSRLITNMYRSHLTSSRLIIL